MNKNSAAAVPNSMKTERNLQDDLKGNQEKAFYIEAPVNEEGPRKLLVIPSDEDFIVYDRDVFLARIKSENEHEWHVSDGIISDGIANVIGKEIRRVY